MPIHRTRSAEVLPQFANFSRVTFGFTPLKFRKKGLRKRTALSLYYSEFNMSNDFQWIFLFLESKANEPFGVKRLAKTAKGQDTFGCVFPL